MFKDLTNSQVGMYLIDCLGYGKEDVSENLESLRDNLTPEEKGACLKYNGYEL